MVYFVVDSSTGDLTHPGSATRGQLTSLGKPQTFETPPRPPAAPPAPKPTLVQTRETAVARWRTSRAASAAMSADCAGSSPPFPAPPTAAAANATAALCARASPAYPA